MDFQNPYPVSFEQGSKPRSFPHPGEDYDLDLTNPIMKSQGGTEMYRNPSNESAYSSYSPSSGSSPNTISYGAPSPAQDYEPNYDIYKSMAGSVYRDDHSSTRHRLEQNEEVRHTPDSLGWAPGTELLKLYEFKVPKGRQPYLELCPCWDATFETPRRVYLDTGTTEKGIHDCKFPNGCRGIFKRTADLDRHYINVHAADDQKQRFACDYPRCPRSTEPFTRKDHYRDHLKDYHKEDMGNAKKSKNLTDKERKRAERRWREERQITPTWWRCGKCLVRVKDSWNCPECKQSCESERVTVRQQMAQSLTPRPQSSDDTATSNYNTEYDQNSASYLSCNICQDGWIENLNNNCWDPCHNCQPPASNEPAAASYYPEYSSSSYGGSYST